MIIAELTVVPLGTGTPSVSRYVVKAVDELRKLGLEPQLTAMGTIIEAAELSVILEAVKRIHESVFRQRHNSHYPISICPSFFPQLCHKRKHLCSYLVGFDRGVALIRVAE